MSNIYKYDFETLWASNGYTHVLGIDGVGLGALFGAIHVGGVLLRIDARIKGVYDSKKLDAAKRIAVLPLIHKEAVATHIAVLEVGDYNQHGPRKCEILGASECVNRILDNTDVDPNKVMIVLDGPYPSGCLNIGLLGFTAMSKADSLVLAVGAASVLAKVSRDTEVEALALVHPEYDLASHKGYCAPKHIEAIGKYGMTSHHRYCAAKFLKKADDLEDKTEDKPVDKAI